MQEADYGQTAAAMGNVNNRYAADENLLVRFYMSPARDKRASAKEGRPIFNDVPFVHIMQPGNKESIIHRKATQMDKDRFIEHFRKFEARESQETTGGTPLIEWPGATRSQVEELKFWNISTIEQLLGMSDTNAQNFRGINDLRTRAQAFLDVSKDNAGAEALAAAEAKNAELQETVTRMAARLDALEEEPPAAETTAPKARRRKA
jgi:hypothetical protein